MKRIAIIAALVAAPCFAQTYNSTSTGADGALDLTGTPPGTIVTFNPASYTPPLDPAHDNIFNFTTVNIPTGVTVRLSGRNLTGPIYWLASGPIVINGTIDLSGENGAAQDVNIVNRVIAFPVPGATQAGSAAAPTPHPPTLPPMDKVPPAASPARGATITTTA